MVHVYIFAKIDMSATICEKVKWQVARGNQRFVVQMSIKRDEKYLKQMPKAIYY